MYPNKEAGLGSKMVAAVFDNAMFSNPTTGRVFIVGKAALANISEIKAIYGALYPDGYPVVYTTIALAVASCVAARGDLILVAPGHTESISSNTALTMSISGVQVVGLGIGSQRPVITFDTANTATINVSANGVSFKNIVFVANFLAIASAFTLTTATDFQLLQCEFRDTSNVLDFLFIVTTATTANAADGIVIDGCKIMSTTAAGVQGLISFLGANDRSVIRNNYYTSLSTNTAAILPIAAGKAVTNLLILNNIMNITNAAGTGTGYLITANTAGTGFIDGNRFSALPTTPLLVTAGRGFAYGINYHTDTADTSGYIIPAQDS